MSRVETGGLLVAPILHDFIEKRRSQTPGLRVPLLGEALPG